MEEDRKCVKEEESEIQKSPEPPPIPLAPIDLPPLQSLSLSAASFICEMPNCGAVRVFAVFYQYERCLVQWIGH